MGHTQTVQPGHGQKGRHGHALVQFAHPGLHIAAEFDQLQIRPAQFQLRPPPQRGRADHRALRQIGQAGKARRNKAIAHIFARQIAIQHQPVRLDGRHVLHRMHGDVDAAVQQRLFDLAREQAFAANFFQRLVQHLIARHLDDHNLKGGFRQGKGRHQAAPHLMRLPKRQRRTTGADLQRLGGGGHRVCHGYSLNAVSFT